MKSIERIEVTGDSETDGRIYSHLVDRTNRLTAIKMEENDKKYECFLSDNYKNRIPSFCVERSEGGTLYEGYSYDEKNIKDAYEVISTRNHLR